MSNKLNRIGQGTAQCKLIVVLGRCHSKTYLASRFFSGTNQWVGARDMANWRKRSFFAQKVLKFSGFQEEKKSENLVSRKDNIEFINQSTKCVKFVPKD